MGLEMPDLKLRRWLFALVLAAGVLFYALNRVVKERETYDAVHQVAMPYDAYGLALARIGPKEPGKLRVVLIGNSAYQMWPVAHALHERAVHDPRGIEMINLAQAGSGIADHVVHCAFALAQDPKPDLVVLTVGSFSFGNMGFKFNTECPSVPFEPRVAKWLPPAFYRWQYDSHSAADAAVGAALPLKQVEPIVRFRLFRDWSKSSDLMKNWIGLLQRRLQLPSMNRIAAEFDAARRRGVYHEGAAWLERPLRPDFAARCDEILAMLDHQGIPVLVIREPCMHYPMSDAVTPYLQGLEARWPGVRFVDLEAEWRKENFMDQIHPLQDYAPTYAERHYKLMMEELDKHYPSAANGKRS